VKPIWLNPGVEPEDSWRKRNPETQDSERDFLV
jgi:hypothetical protein